MRLGALQDLLREFYALDVEYEVDDFVTSDATVARTLDGSGRQLDEKLLIAEGGDEAEVSLYLGAQLLERLDRSNPLTRLDADNLEDFWTAFEGVSHFTYYAWNAQLEKPVTLLEMELQAEVDKYIATTLLLARQGQRASHGLHHWLFGLTHLDDRLDGPERDRYRNANHYAGKYCRKLASAVVRDANDERVQTELRRFYRYSQTSKIGHIESAAR